MAEEPSSTSAAIWGIESTGLTNFSGTFVLSLFLGQLFSWPFYFLPQTFPQQFRYTPAITIPKTVL